MSQDHEGPVPPTGTPAWAHSSTADEEAIEHRRVLGQVFSAGGSEVISVQVVQRLEIGAGDPSAAGENPQIVLAGVRLDLPEAVELCRLLATACRLLESLSP